MQPNVLPHMELKSRVAGTHRGWENTAPTYSSVSCSVGRSYQAGPASFIPVFLDFLICKGSWGRNVRVIIFSILSPVALKQQQMRISS